MQNRVKNSTGKSITIALACKYLESNKQRMPNFCNYLALISDDKYVEMVSHNPDKAPYLPFHGIVNTIIQKFDIKPGDTVRLISHSMSELYKCTNMHSVFLKKGLFTIPEINRAYDDLNILCEKYNMYYNLRSMNGMYNGKLLFKSDKNIQKFIKAIKKSNPNSVADINTLEKSIYSLAKYKRFADSDNPKLKYCKKIFELLYTIDAAYLALYKTRKQKEYDKKTKDYVDLSLDERIVALTKTIKQGKKELIETHKLRHNGSKVYGAFEYRKRNFEIIDTTLLLTDASIYELANDFGIIIDKDYEDYPKVIEALTMNICLNKEHAQEELELQNNIKTTENPNCRELNQRYKDYKHQISQEELLNIDNRKNHFYPCAKIARANLIIYNTFRTKIVETLFRMLDNIKGKMSSFLCSCIIENIELKSYCDQCAQNLRDNIQNKTFFTLSSISEYIMVQLSKSYTHVEHNTQATVLSNYKYMSTTVHAESHLKQETKLLIDWQHYFRCRQDIDITGPHNTQYLVGEYTDYNIVDVDLKSAYPTIMSNLFKYVFDFASFKTLRKSEKALKQEIEELNKKSIPFLVKVAFEYKEGYQYAMISTENDITTSLYLRKGISKFITCYEYNRLIADENVKLRPLVVKYCQAYENLNTPFACIMEVLLSQRESKTADSALNKVDKLLSNSIYGKLLQLKNSKKTRYSMTTGKNEPGKASSLANPYLGNLIIGACKAIVGCLISQAHKADIKVASSMTDGCVLITKMSHDYITATLRQAADHVVINSILKSMAFMHCIDKTSKIFSLKAKVDNGVYIGIKKRLEAILDKDLNIVKQSIGPFARKDKINVRDIYYRYQALKPIIIQKRDKVSMQTILEENIINLPDRTIIPNFDPNIDKKAIISNDQNYELHPHDNILDLILTKRRYEYNKEQYRYHHKNKTEHSFINGYLHSSERRLKLKETITLDHMKLGGYPYTMCVLKRLAYLDDYKPHNGSRGSYDENRIFDKAKDGKKCYKKTYSLAKNLGILTKKGQKGKLSDSGFSECINKVFLKEIIYKAKIKLSDLSMDKDGWDYMEEYIKKQYTNDYKQAVQKLEEFMNHLQKDKKENEKIDNTIKSELKDDIKRLKAALQFVNTLLNSIRRKIKIVDIRRKVYSVVKINDVFKILHINNIRISKILSQSKSEYWSKLKHQKPGGPPINEDAKYNIPEPKIQI